MRSIYGVFSADNTRRRLANMSESLSDDMDKFITKKYYKVDLAKNPTLGVVSRMLDIAPYVVVVKTDPASCSQKPIGIMTSEILLKHVMNTKQMNGN